MNRIRYGSALAALLLALLLTLNGCVPVPTAPVIATPPATQALGAEDERYYLQLHTAGKPVLAVDTEKSLIVIEVHRGGRLARLGHEHMVASHDVRGRIAPDEGRADLVIPLDSLTVDEVSLRAEAGLDPALPQQAIEGTRRNMLDKVLESAHYPLARVRVIRDAAQADLLHIALTVHGITRNMDVPARITPQGNGVLTEGRISFRQSEFGIVSFSVLGGALQVEDRVDLRFHITAAPLQP
jgi:hypothetical protein